MASRRLDYAARAWRDIDAILDQAEKIAALGLMFHPGVRAGTRECAMQGFPYTLVYVARGGAVRIVRALHQRAEYFNRRKSAAR